MSDLRPPLRDWLVLRDRPGDADPYAHPLGLVQARGADEAREAARRLHGSRVVVTPATGKDRARIACDGGERLERNGGTRGGMR